MARRGDALAWAIALLLVAAAGALTLQRAVYSPAGVLIRQDESAPWIMPRTPVTARLQQWGHTEAPAVVFSTRFHQAVAGAPAVVELRAFGAFELSVNGTPVAAAQKDGRDWKRATRVEVSELLRAGENELGVEVRNRRGPALLSLRLTAPGLLVTSGSQWSARIEPLLTVPAVLASDVRPHPEAAAGESPRAALRERRNALGLLFLLPAAVVLLWRRPAPVALRRLPAVALAVVALAWVALFVTKFLDIDLRTGFDAGNHLVYLDLVRSERRIPLATEGWSTYHPPLFYVASALLAGALEGVASRAFALKLLPFLAGLGNVVVAAALARRLLAEQRSAEVHAILFAGLLPMNLGTAACFSNEGLHAFLSGAALLVAVGLLLDPAPRLARLALLSGLLGLALLTKFTALVVAVPTLACVGLRLALAERRRPGRLARGLALLLLPALGLAGWFYARNLVEFGRPVVGNWSLPGPGRTWWSPPGFHTPAYYLAFGEVLVRPYFSGFVSFWDALYSTLFGDGMLAGRASLRARDPHWSYDYMAAGYALALPALAFLAAGAFRALRAAFGDPEPRRRAAFGLLLVVCAGLGFAIFYTTLALPFLGQARASYALAATPALAVLFGAGAAALERWLAARRWRSGRALLYGWLGALYGCFFLSFAA